MKETFKQFIKDIIAELTYVPKRQRVEPSRLPAGTLTTVLGLVTCVVLFCATSFAWITRDVGTSSQLDIAEYGMTITDPNGNEVTTEYTFPLAAGDNHTFTLKATGTASTGYCLVYVNDSLLGHTGQVSPGASTPTSITLNITAAAGKTVRFQPLWGTHPDNVNAVSLFSLLGFDRAETMFHSNTPHLLFEIPFGAKAEDLAAHYFPADPQKGLADILLYNGIDKLPEAGKEIRIPFVTEHPDGKPYTPVLYPLGGYTVVEGDTMESVAKALGVTTEMLTAAGIKAEALVPGAVITVKAADDADSMEYYATGVTITIKAPDSDKTNHYYTSGGVVDGKPQFPDADKNDHYYTGSGVQDGQPQFPDADKNDHYYTGSGVQDGQPQFPAPGDNDADKPGEGDGDANQPDEGGDDANQPDEGDGDADVPDGGDADADEPDEGDGDANQPEDSDASDADRNDHYYIGSGVEDGKPEFPDTDKNDHYYTGSGVQDGEVTPAPGDDTDVDSPDSEEVSAVKSSAGDESSEDTYTGDDPNDDPTTENNPTTTGPAELYE